MTEYKHELSQTVRTVHFHSAIGIFLIVFIEF